VPTKNGGELALYQPADWQYIQNKQNPLCGCGKEIVWQFQQPQKCGRREHGSL
jgi:hypothetical protein